MGLGATAFPIVGAIRGAAGVYTLAWVLAIAGVALSGRVAGQRAATRPSAPVARAYMEERVGGAEALNLAMRVILGINGGSAYVESRVACVSTG